ncbi:non-ribosomal peptide synthetase [Pseudozyma hubeiensis SY62]|uniref:Non-ribosomal peptide synthetase n=1 Tax=Pseudozyma hubeiensis (strain SY62) TaxID=1305764 RepID=R9NZQ8_PSEHS|nr:non-ribosomal peptide synthetase [Pseudozyma hubeiensis SY62]GAC94353.1 non-ribosomal peptide synthetase [Pseudozyma hubeiensis SY62]
MMTLSRLPALHPYSSIAAGGTRSGAKSFKFALQDDAKSIEDIEDSHVQQKTVSRLVTFVAQLTGCDADEVLFKLQIFRDDLRVASAKDVQQHASPSSPGITFCFYPSTTAMAAAGTDDLVVTVSDKDGIQVLLDFALPVSEEAAHGICTHFARQVLCCKLVKTTAALSIFDRTLKSEAPQQARLHDAFLQQAKQCPDRIAVQFLEALGEDGTARFSRLTYAQLHKAASLLASKVRYAHARKEKQQHQQVIVPMLLSPSIELYISYMAILMAGFAFCPLPVDAPDARLTMLVSQLHPSVILGAHSSDPPSWLPASVHWINVTENVQDDSWSVNENDVVFQQQQECAYVLFTSGTTGKPKGVQISHHSASVSIASHAAQLDPSLLQESPCSSRTSFKWFQFASTVFDPSVMEIFVTLSSGGTLCSAPRALTLSDLEKVVRLSEADIMMATPSVATLLRPEHVPSLRFLWTMGESLNPTVIRNFADDRGRTVLANAYGPTEASVNCTLLQPFPADFRGSIIGLPLPACSLAIVCERYDPESHRNHLEAVERGMTGELVIGGPHVGMGYLDMPKATADAFTTFAPLGRVYRTQDRARLVWDRDGNPMIEILGRMNAEQVKLSGRRVEFGEVDSVLQTSRLVQNAACVVWRPAKQNEQVSGSERLVCCLVPSSDCVKYDEAEADCRAIAEAQLPPHMRPWKYILRSSLPVTVSGKADRKQLSQLLSDVMDASHEQDRGSDVTFQEATGSADTPISQALIKAVCTVCRFDTGAVQMNVDLFELGIDSLAAMRLLQLLRQDEATASAAVQLSVAQVLKAGSCAQLVDLLSSKEGGESARHNKCVSFDDQQKHEWSHIVASFQQRCRHAVLSALAQDELCERVQAIYPTTATQSGMLTNFLSRADTLGCRRPYINHTVYHMASASQAREFHDAFQRATRKHDIFRTVFVPIDDELSPFAQCVLSPGLDQGNVSETISTATLDSALEKHLGRIDGSISLDRPPWHLGLLLPGSKEEGTGGAVVLSMMHAIFDGGSLNLIQEEALALLDNDPLHAALPTTCTELESAVRHHFTSDLEAARQFWRHKLDGISKTQLPCVNGCKATVQSSLVNSYAVVESHSRSSMDKIVKRAGSQGTTALVLMQTAWNLLLAAYSEDEEVVCVTSGSVHSGRLDDETRYCMAPTFNVVPFVTRLGVDGDGVKNVTTAELVAEATKSSTDALAHLEIPLGALASSGGIPFDTLFAVQRFANLGQESSATAPWSSITYPVMANDFAAMVEVWPSAKAEGEMRLRLTYSESVLDAASAELLLQQYDDLLHRLMFEPKTTPIKRIVNGAGLRTSALSIFENLESKEEGERGLLLHSQFESRAAAQPEDVAVEFFAALPSRVSESVDVQRWTYGELNARANRLARYILSLTGQTSLRDQPIPICMERCIELYVAVLAILKAGGAWCPIDVQSPRARQLELMARTKSNIVLVTAATSASLGIVQVEGQRKLTHLDACDASTYDHFFAADLEATAGSTTLAYLIWTSGTTGAPKGVMIEHQSAVTSMNALQHHVPPPHQGRPPRCLQFSAYTFDVFVQDLFWTWGLGGTVIATTREIVLGSTAELATASHADHAHLTPAFAAGLPRASFPSLRSVTFIGEKLTEAVAADWAGDQHSDQLDPIAVYNTYGPAEVTVVATLRRLDPDETLNSANVGLPMKGVTALVCRDRLQPPTPCGKGMVGELVLAGDQVGRGYLDDKTKTEAAFVFSPVWQKKLYYTGDYVRMLHDGSIEFIGRRDDLVKLGGIRVELSEISAALLSVQSGGAQVQRAETMMLSRPDRPSKQVIGFLACPDLVAAATAPQTLLLTHSDAIALSRRTLNEVRGVLPPYMVPSMILVLSHIPQTASAKIDRPKLQAAYASADLAVWTSSSSSACNGRPSEMESEKTIAPLHHQVAKAISGITGTNVVHITGTSSLASIGLDSIRSIRLAVKLQQEGLQVPISTLLACSTVRMLVDALVRHSEEGAAGVQDDARSRYIASELRKFDANVRKLLTTQLQKRLRAVLPCSTLQGGMLAETLADPLAYWTDHVIRLDADVNLSRFAQAWKRSAQSLEMLRTTFAIVSQNSDLKHPVQFDGELDVFALQMLHSSVDVSCIDVRSPIHPTSGQKMQQAVARWTRSVALDRAEAGLSVRPLWAVRTFSLDRDGDSVVYAALCIHHALYDGPSIAMILDRVRAEYDGIDHQATTGPKRDTNLPAPTSLFEQCKYAFAFSTEERMSSVEHWKGRLQNRGPAAGLPDLTSARCPPGRASSAKFLTTSRTFRPCSTNSLNVGISTAIKTAFAMVLANYVEIEEPRHIVLGEVLSLRHLHRSLSTEKGAVGPLLTTLPFSLLLAADSTCQSVRSTFRSDTIAHPLMQHRFASLSDLSKIMATRSDREIFTAMYVYHQRSGHPELSLHEPSRSKDDDPWMLLTSASNVRVEHGTVLNVFEQGESEDESIILELSMKEDRVSEAMLDVVIDQVLALLELMFDSPDETWRRLFDKIVQDNSSLASACTVPRSDGSTTGLETIYREHDPLHWLHYYAQKYPSWPAVIIAANPSPAGSIRDAALSTWTYAELSNKAAQVAHLIQLLDLPLEGPIALCMDRTLISLAVTVAIFKCGRTYLPIDKQLPDERKRLLISDSRSALVVTEGTCLGQLEDECHCPVLNLSKATLEQRLLTLNVKDGSVDHAAPDEGRGSDGAYLLYTSGSTGKPKGVLVGRANLCSFVESYAEIVSSECPATLNLGGIGRYLGLASRAFDVHLSQMFMSWRFGMALATGERSLLLGDLKCTIQRMSITHMSCVPSLLDQCDLVAQEVPSLVFLGVGGEKLTDRVRDTLASSLTVLNAYGPTETTIMCTVNAVHADSHVRDIGRVLPGNTAIVIDFDDTDRCIPVMRGQAGELCIRGDLVALGYHALDASQEASSGFVMLSDGTRMYRTGDAVRMTADGKLHYLGRRDEQEKIRGQRLELGEVSRCAIAGANDTVHARTVICQPRNLMKPLLITLISPKIVSSGAQRRDSLPQLLTPSSDMNQVAQHIHRYCREQLPGYMVPDLVIAVSHLTQLATSGKTDVRRLKEWISSVDPSQLFKASVDSDNGSAAVPSLTVVETKVASALRQILPKTSVEIRPSTSIFDLGIDSLTVIRLAGELRKVGLVVPINQLRLRHRIHEIASDASGRGVANDHDFDFDLSVGRRALSAFRERYSELSSSMRTEVVSHILPCLPSQEGMVALSLGNKSNSIYVARMQVQLDVDSFEDGACSPASIQRAWQRLVQRHSILRTCFDHVDEGTIAQIVLSGIEFDRHLVPARSRDTDSDTILAILQTITAVPPWRISLDEGKASQGVFVLYMHHALYDGYSLPLLLADLTKILRDEPEEVDKQESEMEEFIASILSVPESRAQTFWCSTFAAFPVSDPCIWDRFPLAHTGPFRCKTTLELRPLVSAAKALQVTLSSLIAAALGIAICRMLGTTSFTIGFVLWGRTLDHVSAEKIRAPCLTTVPMPFSACVDHKAQSVTNTIRSCYEWNTSCLAFQHTSMRQIRKWIGSERQGSLVDVLFSFSQTAGSGLEDESRSWRLNKVDAETDAASAFEVVADEASNELRISAMLKHVLPDGGLEGILETLRLLLDKVSDGTAESMDLEAAGVSIPLPATSKALTNGQSRGPERPMTRTEEQIRDLAVKMCGASSADLLKLDTPFLRIGLDSIVALRFSARLRTQYGLQLSAHDILSAGTIMGLSQRLNDRQNKTDSEIATPTTSEHVGERYKATPLQAGMLNGTIASQSHRLYVHHHAVLLKEGVDYDRLQRALRCVVAAHDILRTSFHLESDAAQKPLSWIAKVASPEELLPAPQSLHHLVDKVSSEALEGYENDFTFERPEHFGVSPWRAAVLRCAAKQDVLVISMHHSLYDGVSLPYLFADLRAAYRDESMSLVARPSFYHAANLIASKTGQSEMYWRQTLAGFKHASLLGKALPSQSSLRYRLGELRIPISLGELKTRSAKVGVTPQALALLSWSKVLAVSAGQRDVCFGQVVSGRYLDLPGIEEISGPLINTVPIRVNLVNYVSSNAATARELQERIVEAQPFQHASLSQIQKAWRQQHGAQNALFDTLFVFHNVQGKAKLRSKVKDELWTSIHSPKDVPGQEESHSTATGTAASEYPVNISVIQDDHGIQIKAGASDLVGGEAWLPKTLQLFADVFMDLLQRPNRPIGAYPEALATLPIVSASDVDQQEGATPVDQEADRRRLDGKEQGIVLRHMSKRLNVDAATIKASPSLFLLGLDSLLAICISADARIEQVPLTPFDLLSAGTFGQLTVAFDKQDNNPLGADAEAIERAQKGLISDLARKEVLERLDIPATDVEAFLPVLPGQKQHIDLWLQRGRRFLEPTFVYATSRKVKIEVLDAAWEELHRRNAALRTAFVRLKDHGELVQVVLSESSSLWRCHQRRQLAIVNGNDDVDSAAFDAVKKLNADPTDLSRPSARLTLVQGSKQDLVLLTLHHTSYDAWSMRLMAAELGQIYQSMERRYQLRLREPISFVGFVEQTYWHALRAEASIEAFWAERLRGASSTVVCGGAPQSVDQTMHVRKAAIRDADGMEARCHTHGFGLQVVVILAYARLLSSYVAEEGLKSPTFGFYTAGRSSAFEGLGQMIGPTTSMQPMTVATRSEGPEAVLIQLRSIQKELVHRAEHQQDEVKSPVPFDAHLNLLWHKPIVETDGDEPGSADALLRPYKLRYDSGYFTHQPLMPGRTSVDGDSKDSATKPKNAQLYMDVGFDAKTGAISFGARCDQSAMHTSQLEEFCDAFIVEIEKLRDIL